MVRSRKLRLLLLIILVVGGYRWLGVNIVFIGIVAFMLYELFLPPPRYRKFPAYMKQGLDNFVGIFGRSYSQYEPIQHPMWPAETIPAPVEAAESTSDAVAAIQTDLIWIDTRTPVLIEPFIRV
jgi:hypothetical protein